MRYLPVLIWSVLYNVISMGIGIGLTKFMKLPQWVTPAVAFNNTTALPLLLVQSLDATGILDSLDPTGGSVARAKSYFLINAMVGNSLTFALGPQLLNGQEEDAHDKPEKEEEEDDQQANGSAEDHAERGEAGDDTEESLSDREEANEDTSLLPNRAVREGTRALDKSERKFSHYWKMLPSWLQSTLNFLWQFFNPPLIGAVIGAILGLVPALRRLFFNEQSKGGYLNAWLTGSIKNIGDLFAALQVIVVGVKLSQAMLKMKKGEKSGSVPWKPFMIVSVLRFLIWPLISIPLIWALATKTNWLDQDPILWFAMMLMP